MYQITFSINYKHETIPDLDWHQVITYQSQWYNERVPGDSFFITYTSSM